MNENRYRKLAVCKSLATIIICLFLAELPANYIFNWMTILFVPVRFVYYAMPAVCAVLLMIAAALVLYMLVCFFVHLDDIRTALSENAIYIFL